MEELSKREVRELKGKAQRLDAIIRVGKQGLSPGLISSIDQALKDHELVKVRFDDFKEQKKELAKEISTRTQSALITMVGHVAVYFRRKQKPEDH